MNKLKLMVGGLIISAAALVGIGTFNAATQVSAADCSANAVIKCGVANGDNRSLRAKYNSDATPGTKAIYSWFGYSSDVVNNYVSKVGYVTKSGNVVVDGKVVATDAFSAGRQYISGSTKRSAGGYTFYTRDTQNSFLSNTISAIVWFSPNGQFRGAALYDCGNPVGATPVPVPPAPVAKCDSLTAAKVSRDEYKFTTAATAQNGAKITGYGYNFGDGTVNNNAGATVTHKYAKAGTYKTTVYVRFTVNGAAQTKTCETTVTVAQEVQKPTPVYICDSLTATKISRNEYKFTTATTAKDGATLKSVAYDFGDGKTGTGTTVNHTYAAPGTYTVVATPTFTVDGKDVTAPSNACKATITIEKENCTVPGKEHLPVDSPECKEDKPAVEITKLVNNAETATVTVGTEFEYEISVKNTGNVDLKDVVVTDKAPAQVTLLSVKDNLGKIENNTWTYTLGTLKVGETKKFTLTAKYAAYVAGNHVNNVCVETPTIPGTNPDDCDEATTNTTEDVKVCVIETKEIKTIPRADYNESTMTTDMSKCAEETPTPVNPKAGVPAELPHTGVMDVLGGGLGLSAIAGSTYYYVASRRNLR